MICIMRLLGFRKVDNGGVINSCEILFATRCLDGRAETREKHVRILDSIDGNSAPGCRGAVVRDRQRPRLLGSNPRKGNSQLIALYIKCARAATFLNRVDLQRAATQHNRIDGVVVQSDSDRDHA
jgi:hypothetical protein